MNSSKQTEAVVDRLSPRRVLMCLDGIEIFKIGDMVVRISQMKLLEHYFENASICINCPSWLFADLIKNIAFIDEVSALPATEIAYNNYDLVLLYAEEQSRYTRAITAYCQDRATKFDLFRLNEPFNLDERLSAPPLLSSLFAFNYPEELIRDVNRLDIALSEAELAEGATILDAHQVGNDDNLIIFIYAASAYTKTFKMSLAIELIHYFQSLPGQRLVLFDPFSDKEISLRAMKANLDNVIVLKNLNIRQTFSVMADKRVDLILGPCTGLMHAASGIHNSLLKRNLRTTVPNLVVYTGLYEREGLQNALQWWYGSLAKCLILKQDETGNKRIYTLEELEEPDLPFQENVLPVREYTFDMLREYLHQHFNVGQPAYSLQ